MSTAATVEMPCVQEAIAFPQPNQLTVNCEGIELLKLASISLVKLAFYLKEQAEELGTKTNKYKSLLKELGMPAAEANKFVKLGRHAQAFKPEELSNLGIMMFSLVAPKFDLLWKTMQDKGALTQNELSSLKKELYPTKKVSKSDNPPSIWRQPSGGGNRYCQIPPIHDQETGVKIQQVIDKEGITAQEATKKAFLCYEEAQAKKLASPSVSEGITNSIFSDEQIDTRAKAIPTASTTLLLSPVETEKNLEIKALDTALKPEASPEILATSASESNQAAAVSLPSPTLSVAAAELTTDEEAIASTASDISVSPDVPKENTGESQLETPATEQVIAPGQPIAQPETPSVASTERYKQGWNPGDEAIANTTNSHFVEWCEKQPVIIKKVSGDVGTIQMVTVVRHDGKTRRVGGNWLEDVSPPSSDFKVALYRVVGVDNEWEGRVVKIDSPGEYNHLVSCPQDGAWTHIAPKCLVPLDSTEVTEYAQAEIIHLAQLQNKTASCKSI
jgi:hypothetical protein